MNYRKRALQHSLSKRHLKCFLDFLSAQGYALSPIDDYQLVYRIEGKGLVRYVCDLDFNTTACSRLLKDKLLTYLALEQLEISIPKGTYFLLGQHQYSDSLDEILESLSEMDYPIICKPNDSSLGKGISVLKTFNENRVYNAIAKASEYSDVLIVQEYLSGKEFRVIAVEGEIVLAFEKHENPKPPAEIALTESQLFVDVVSRSMQYLGATLCGFDFIVEDGMTRVLEINSNPFVFQIKNHIDQLTLRRYFSRLEELLRRDYGNRTST